MNPLLQQMLWAKGNQGWANAVNGGWGQSMMNSRAQLPYDQLKAKYDLGMEGYDVQRDLGMEGYDTQNDMNRRDNRSTRYGYKTQNRMNRRDNKTRRYGIDARRDTVQGFMPMISGLVNRPQGGASFGTNFGAGGTSSISKLLGG